jgi:ABC-2 type transport system permease protein
MNAISVATRLGFREQARRPLLLVLLMGLPFFFITRAIAQTEKLPRTIRLPGGEAVLTNMRDIHGADMAAITVAFLAGLVGVFVMQSARQADRRLVAAGFRPSEALAPRLLVLAAATGLVLSVSLVVTAFSFSPRQWPAFILGNLLAGLIYAQLGALAGAVNGHRFLPSGGHRFSPMAATLSPRWWPSVLPDSGSAPVVAEPSP